MEYNQQSIKTTMKNKNEVSRNRLLGSLTRHQRPNRYVRPVSKGLMGRGIVSEVDRSFVPVWNQWCALRATG